MDKKDDLRDPGRAPEVAYSYAPQTTPRESEGLQAVTDPYSDKEDANFLNVEVANGPTGRARRPWYRRKRWIIGIVIALVVVIAAAVGGGVAASSSGQDGKAQNKTGDQSPTPTPTADSSPSSTSSAAVAPATSGIASFSCSNNTYLFSAQPAGLAYNQFCNTVFYFNTENIYGSGLIEGVGTSTKYSFQACVNSCDEWNADNPDAENPCMAVSYYANLTNVFTEHQDWRGNCILKSGVGGVSTNVTDSTDMDWEHTASAYRACLQDGIPCGG